ncbi:hypothetical protein DSM104299_03224 [Baekduia alba]|uniref:hypothetical protein n=1 Tax=Baekduia alba TaxID=2997333 RepID=UPI002340A7C1|nr:hypothetical protein [Baekduia alba]WCB94487.1 hypothetical protein DSM104299_03224 [Baekduia alba]
MKLVKPAVATIIGLTIAGALLWSAGEKHVENCHRFYNKAHCNLLPWSGTITPAPPLTQEQQQSLLRARRAAGQP